MAARAQGRIVAHRSHSFVRYGDDCFIFCKSKRAAERTKASMIRYIESVLYLRVNKEKPHSGYVRGMKFLGSSFYIKSGEYRFNVHPKSYVKLENRLKALTVRSNGMVYEKRKTSLCLFFNGWLEYFKLADMKTRFQRIDEWYRHRLRVCIWKCRKKVKTRFKNLSRCGINR